MRLLRPLSGGLAMTLLVYFFLFTSRAYPFGEEILIDPSARASGLGICGVSIDRDSAFTRYNPAVYARLANSEAKFSTTKWYMDESINLFQIAIPHPWPMGFGFTYQQFSDESFNTGGAAYNYKWAAYTMGAGVNLGKKAALGLALRNVSLDLSKNSFSQPYFDTGIMLAGKTFTAGFSMLNFGPEFEVQNNYYKMLREVRLGLSAKTEKAVLAMELLSKGYDYNSFSFGLGLEYYIGGILGLRFAPVFSGRFENPRFAFGLGLKLKKFMLDWTVTSSGPLGNVHRIDLAFQFGKKNVHPDEEPEKREEQPPVSPFIKGELEEIKPVPAAPKPPVKAEPVTPFVPVPQPVIKTEGERINIAVLEFTATDLSSSESSFVSELFRDEFSKYPKFRLVAKESMDKVMVEQGFQQTGCTTQECAIQMGKVLNVKYMLMGTIGKTFGKYYIASKMVSVETAEIILSEKATNLEESQDALIDSIAVITSKINSAFK